MKKKGLILFFLAVTFFASAWIFKTLLEQSALKEKNLPIFFVSVPIKQFAPFQSPCLDLRMNDQKILALIDLGFNGYVSLKKEIVEKIPEKKLIKTQTMYGWKGKQYLENIYEIPNLSIKELKFYNLLLNEANPEFRKDSIVVQTEDALFEEKIDGKIGWKLFKKIGLFLDLENSQIAFCDCLETFKKQGYSLDSFTQLPIFFDHDLVEIEAHTSDGNLKYILDTGSTWNVIAKEGQQTETAKEMALNPDYISTIPSFQMNGTDFGPLTFHYFPMKFPFKIEGILGVDFLINHQVFIDFPNHLVYIAKTKPKTNQ